MLQKTNIRQLQVVNFTETISTLHGMSEATTRTRNNIRALLGHIGNSVDKFCSE